MSNPWPLEARNVDCASDAWTLAMAMVHQVLSTVEGPEAKAILRNLYDEFMASRLISDMQDDLDLQEDFQVQQNIDKELG